MGLAAALAARAAAHAHVLLVEAPGELPLLLHADRCVRELGLVRAASPADADVLLFCGALGEGLSEPVEAIWKSMVEPRARAQVRRPADIRVALEAAQSELRDTAAQQESARSRSRAPALAPDNAVSGEEGDDGTDHGGDHDMDMDDEMDMDMDHDMDMSPSGIPLAGGAEDRDGLEMDVLHLPLGPILGHWPAGLTLNCTIAGDLVTAATVETLASSAWVPDALHSCHGLASVLSLTGWEAGASLARRAGDDVLRGSPDAGRDALRRLEVRLRRNLLLRWMLHDVAIIDAHTVQRHDLPLQLRGDAFDRLSALAELARQQLTEKKSDGDGATRGQEALLAALPELVSGLELASVRLLVASSIPLVGAPLVGPPGKQRARD